MNWMPTYGPAEQTDILFDVDGFRHKYRLVHNLGSFGYKMDSAFMTWICRTEIYSAKSLKEYVTSKDPENFRVIIRSEKIFKIQDN